MKHHKCLLNVSDEFLQIVSRSIQSTSPGSIAESVKEEVANELKRRAESSRCMKMMVVDSVRQVQGRPHGVDCFRIGYYNPKTEERGYVLGSRTPPFGLDDPITREPATAEQIIQTKYPNTARDEAGYHWPYLTAASLALMTIRTLLKS